MRRCNKKSGILWVIKAAQLYDGYFTIIHPLTLHGYEIYVQNVETYLALCILLTENLVKENDEKYIPPSKNKGNIQFWQYEWTLMKRVDINENFTLINMRCYDIHLGSGVSITRKIAKFDNKRTIIIFDSPLKFSFVENYSFEDFLPRMTIIQFMTKDEVKETLEQMKK